MIPLTMLIAVTKLVCAEIPCFRYTILLPGADAHCVVTIYEHWSGTTEVVEDKCQEIQVRGGGLWEEKVDDPELLRLLEETYLSSINLSVEDVVVERIQSQLVAGFIYR